MVYGAYSREVNYKWLDPQDGNWYSGGLSFIQCTGFPNITLGYHSPFHPEWMKAVSVSKYEHYLMGGYTNSKGKSTG